MPITKNRVSKNKNYKTIEEAVLPEVDKALETAFFYGFKPVKRPALKKEDSSTVEDLDKEICYLNTEEDLKKCHRIEEKMSVLRNYSGSINKAVSPEMFCYKTSEKNKKQSFLNLVVLGNFNSVSEIIAIKTSIAILSEKEPKELSIEINSIGDKESFSRFEKDFWIHVKKNIDSLPDDFRQVVSTSNNLKEILSHHQEENLADFWTTAPKPIHYLTPLSIKHFKEVLEYLESFEVSYDINHFLIPNKDYCHQTVFRIKDEKGGELALGIQHCNLARRAGLKKDFSFLTVAVKDNLSSKKISLNKIRPKFYLVQFGAKAKMKSLLVIESLRQAGVPLYHSLTRDKLTGQLSAAESLKPAYILIIGEKEALENSVIVRNMETRVQEVVPSEKIVSYLKRIRV